MDTDAKRACSSDLACMEGRRVTRGRLALRQKITKVRKERQKKQGRCRENKEETTGLMSSIGMGHEFPAVCCATGSESANSVWHTVCPAAG